MRQHYWFNFMRKMLQRQWQCRGMQGALAQMESNAAAAMARFKSFRAAGAAGKEEAEPSPSVRSEELLPDSPPAANLRSDSALPDGPFLPIARIVLSSC